MLQARPRMRRSPRLRVDRQSFDAPLIDLFFAYEFREGSGMLTEAQAFLRADAEKTLSCERVLKETEHAILQSAIEINHNVPARDQVHFGERGIRHQTVVGEHHVPAQAFIE